MQNNFKLNHAVALALGMLAVASQQPAWALGLGDLELNSYLGEPLKAKIQVLGADDIKDINCIRLAPAEGHYEAMGRVQFKLGPVKEDIAILSLIGTNPVNEPILNLKVVADCNTTVEREYVLLVDPALTANNDTIETAPEKRADSSVVAESAPSADPALTSTAPTAIKSTNYKKNSKKNRRLAQNLAANTSQSPVTTIANSTPKPDNRQPRLSISGSAASNTIMYGDLPKMSALHMDRQLTFDPNTASAAVAVSDVQDEVTAMNNRLAHLQAQVSTLQEKNNQLLAENQLKTEQINKVNAQENQSLWLDRFTSWLIPAFAAAALAVGAYYAFYWLRRRQTVKLEQETEALWEQLDQPENEFKSLAEEDIFSDIKPAKVNTSVENLTSMQASFESTKTLEPLIVVEEDNQELSVLDHADVFLSHGRASLAIQLLQNHLLDFPKQSITIWLFLLDLLAKENMETLYKETVLGCKKHFNVKISEFAAMEKDSDESLESFPRLAEGLQAVWNTAAAISYLNDLIYNTRSEPRNGLSKKLLEELIMLKTVAQENLNSAEVIQLDEKKLAKEQKLAKKNKPVAPAEILDGPLLFDSSEAAEPHDEKMFEFSLVDYK